jgi:hypothetical protein
MWATYRFAIAPCAADLEVIHNLITPNEWQDKAQAGCLVVGSGGVDASESDRLICHAGIDGNPPVITLIDATWNSNPGDTGAATCDMCTNTPDQQSWTLTSKT